ncbi:hypothetical protein DRO66_02385, partial [Candidatus Bathyarchaeota archaeon]
MLSSSKMNLGMCPLENIQNRKVYKKAMKSIGFTIERLYPLPEGTKLTYLSIEIEDDLKRWLGDQFSSTVTLEISGKSPDTVQSKVRIFRDNLFIFDFKWSLSSTLMENLKKSRSKGTFPVDTVAIKGCALCGADVQGDFTYMSVGALPTESCELSNHMDGFMSVGWHPPHEEGASGEVALIKETKGGQADLYFCSTNCMRHFLNKAVDK